MGLQRTLLVDLLLNLALQTFAQQILSRSPHLDGLRLHIATPVNGDRRLLFVGRASLRLGQVLQIGRLQQEIGHGSGGRYEVALQRRSIEVDERSTLNR